MFSLLIIIPVVVLVLAALGILILQQSRPSIGYSWLIAALTSLVVFGIVFALRWQIPLELVMRHWLSTEQSAGSLSFLLDEITWPYALCLTVLALATIFSDSARLESEARPSGWIVDLSLTAVGLLAVMAGNLLTLVMTWTAVDLIELILILNSEAGRQRGQQTVTAFSIRFSGSLLVILAILYARSLSIPTDLRLIQEPLIIFLLLAVGLRLGVLPLNLPYTREVYTVRGVGNTARMLGAASNLVVLGHIPETARLIGWQPFLLGLTALAAIYGSAMWLASEHELNGRPYWLIALAALAIASAFNGSPRASVAWGITLLLPGSLIFLFTAHQRGNPILPLLALIGFSGLPFTPLAGGWVGITAGKISFHALTFLLSVVFLILGYLRHTFHPRDELHHMERWVHAVYPVGLVFLIVTHWVLGIFGPPCTLTFGIWWASLVVLGLSGAGFVVAFTHRNVLSSGSGIWIRSTLQKIGTALGSFFRLNWLYRFLLRVYHMIQAVIQLITAILEGDGGFLWSLVMLALLLSLAFSGGMP